MTDVNIDPLLGKRERASDKVMDDFITGLEGRRYTGKEYQRDPIKWMVEAMGIDPRTLKWSLLGAYKDHRWDGHEDPLIEIAKGLATWDKESDRPLGEDVAVESATATGKTYFAALLVFWFLHCFPGSRIITIAPKEDQLKLHLWSEIEELWPRFQKLNPDAQLMTLRIRMSPPSDKWVAIGYPVGVGSAEKSATRIQGWHGPHQLFILEETPGIDQAIITAIENTNTSPHNMLLALGNPDHQADTLHRLAEWDTTRHVRMSSLDHPNIVLDDPYFIPGAASKQKNDKRAKKYGEDNPIYLSRVRGICPAESEHSLIKLSWLKRASQLASEFSYELRQEGPPAMGVDVANSTKGDEASLARGKGALVEDIVSFQCEDANVLGRNVYTEAKSSGIKGDNVGVDAIGVGAGTVNEIKRLGMYVQAIKGSESPVYDASEEEFYNLRAQMWWKLRMDLQHDRIGLPDDEELFADLIIPRWEIRNGKIKLESKDAIRKRLGRSPDRGDAVVMWNFVRDGVGASTTPLIGRAA